MTKSSNPKGFPNGLSPYYVDPNSKEVVDYVYHHWRTYETFPDTRFKDDPDTDVIGYIFSESFSRTGLDKLFNIKDKFHHRNFGFITEMMFMTLYPMELHEIRSIINYNDDFQEVYTWIPTIAVFIGRRICLASIQKWSPHCKVVGVTEDDGKIRKLMVTIYPSANSMCSDLNKELAYYNERKGHFKLNFEVDLEGICFPRAPRYRN